MSTTSTDAHASTSAAGSTATQTCRPSRLRRWLPLLVLSLTFAVYASTGAREGTNNDVYSASVASWTIATTGAPWLEVLPADAYHHPNSDWTTAAPAANGHTVIARSPGVIAAGVPAYWVWHAVAGADDFGLGPETISAALLAALAVMLLYLSLCQRLDTRLALVVSAVYAFTTPMWSVVGNAMWTHTVTILGILGMAWAASRERWWLVGLFGGLAVWGRLHTAVIVAVVGLGVAVLRRRPGVAVQVALPSLAATALAAAWSGWMYGTWFPSGGYDGVATTSRVSSGFGSSTWDSVTNHLGMWVSPDRGILVWTPVLLVVAPAVVRAWKELPDWSRVLPVGGLLYTLAQAQLNTFTGGDGFYGYRHAMELLACLTPAIAFSLHRLGPVARRLVGPVVGLQLAAFLVGALSEGWFLVYTDAWRDNSFALALRHEPLVVVWAVLAVTIGTLAGVAWRERAASRDRPASSQRAAALTQRSSVD